MNPSEVDMSYEEAGWDGQGDEEKYKEEGEDPYEGEGQVPGGGVWTMTLPSSLRNLRPDTSSPGWPLIP